MGKSVLQLFIFGMMTILMPAFGVFESSLEDKIPQDNCRYKTFQHALQLMDERQARVIVETGTARFGKCNCLGDGCATFVFAEWASQHGAMVYSVDISQAALLRAERDLEELNEFVVLVHSDSVEFLKQFNQTIDFLYLDSYDFEIENPDPSQAHHLKEIIAAYPRLSENSVVMIDDCGFSNGGKGKLVIKYLLNKGWRIVVSDYQIILIRK